MTDNPNLHKIRQHIILNQESLRKAYQNLDFVEKFGHIQGEKNKHITPEFQGYLAIEPFIVNKQFYFAA